ncbi:hypothetical protein ACH4Q7_22925 [Streptomyces roseolus]|uniref:hypothetical protein n=1 Tax=Streptomyces roseolus TaxID=67358 RepID=UPI0037968787
MATKRFAFNKEPHTAEIGDEVVLKFHAEIYGDEFLEAYERLTQGFKRLGVDLGDLSGTDPQTLRATIRTLRGFLARLMLPESAEAFARWVVVKGGKDLAVYSDPDEADEHLVREEGATLRDESLRLPDRILVGLLEWSIELYGGGSRPSTSSTGSSRASQPAGTPGRAPSRSRA